MNQPLTVDIAIVGAGMVGLAFVAALPNNQFTIALIDQMSEPSAPADFSQHSLPFDKRVSALTLASQQLLTQVGAWPFITEKACAYQQMKVWDGSGTGHIEFAASEIHETHLGHIVENSGTQQALWQIVKQKPNVTLLFNQSVSVLKPETSQHRELVLSNGQTICAKLIIAADGARSSLRELAHIPLKQWSYDHTAIVTTVRCEKSHQLTAWQRFTNSGPLAFLPLITPNGDTHYCSIVWSQQTETAQQLLALNDDEFKTALGNAFEHKLGTILEIDQRVGVELMQRHATDYIKPRFTVIGDAAHTIHPLAGQGVNLGFLDAATLAEVITRAQQRGDDIGSARVLDKFARQRQGHNLTMMATMEGFKRLFEADALPLRWLRNQGLNWVNNCHPIKQRIMRNAVGLSGDLPDLVKRRSC